MNYLSEDKLEKLGEEAQLTFHSQITTGLDIV